MNKIKLDARFVGLCIIALIIAIIVAAGLQVKHAAASDCWVEFFDTSPASPVVVGTDILMHGKGNCSGGVRAVRFTVDADSKAETSIPEQSEYFRTNEYGAGTHTLCFWVAGGSDGSWDAAAKDCRTYEVLPQDSGGDSDDDSGNDIAKCWVESFNLSPASPVVVGTDVLMYGKGGCDGGVRAVRFTVDGDSKAEIGLPEQSEYFRTNEYGTGTHTLCFWVAGGSDSSWSAAARDCRYFEVIQENRGDDSNDDSGNGVTNCWVEFFNISPSSPVVLGTDVLMQGKGGCDGGVRAVRFTVDGDSKAEIGLPKQSEYFRTNEYGIGTHTLCFWVAGGSDGSWDAAARECIKYNVAQSPLDITPESPEWSQESNAPSSDSTWYVGARIGLCAGAQIRTGSGFSYPTHTIVPENNWQVDIIDGPRNANGVTWWDISRENIDGGGTGWIYFEQAGLCGSNSDSGQTSDSDNEGNASSESSEGNNQSVEETPPQSESQESEPTPNNLPYLEVVVDNPIGDFLANSCTNSDLNILERILIQQIFPCRWADPQVVISHIQECAREGHIWSRSRWQGCIEAVIDFMPLRVLFK